MRRFKAIAILLAICILLCGCTYLMPKQEEAEPAPVVPTQQAEEGSLSAEETQESFLGDKANVTPAPQATQTVSEDQAYTKTVFSYTVKFTLPGEWVDAVTMDVGEEYIRFTHTESAPYGGLLMLFYFNDIGENDPAFIRLGQIDGYEYGYALPMDVQFDPSHQAQYESLAAQIKVIAASFTVSGAEGDADMFEQQTHPLGNYLVSFYMPSGWEDVRVEVHETSICFYHTPSQSDGGLLFIFAINPIGESEPAFEMIGQIDDYEYGYVMPMDVQFPPDQQAAYEALQSQVPELLGSIYVR